MPGTSKTKGPTKTASKKPASAPKSKSGLEASNATIDPRNPIPFDNRGWAFSLVNDTRYIPFLGENPHFGQDLLETRLTSTTHNACVTTKRDYCAGIGFQDQDGADFPENITEWLSSLNRHDENEVDINQAILESHFTWGNTPIEIVRLTVGKKKRLFIYVHDFLEWRLCPPDEDGVITEAVQSKLFLDQSRVMSPEDYKKAKKLPIYNPMQSEAKNWYRDDNQTERTLIWLKNKIAGFPHYGMPSALASMIFQLLEYKGGRYELDGFDNNMVVSAILALKGNLGPEETSRIAKQIISTHTGDGKRGRVAVVSSEEGIEDSAFHSFDTQKEGSYNEADNKWTQKIILANEWDAILAGIVSPSTLGKGSGFLTKILELKTNTVIRPLQAKLIKKVWRHIFKIAEDWLGLPFNDFTISFKNVLDISGLTDVDITPAVTRNEVRKAKGLPEDPTEKGSEYMKSTGPQTGAPQTQDGGGQQNVPG
jgi:hypothetical protein